MKRALLMASVLVSLPLANSAFAAVDNDAIMEQLKAMQAEMKELKGEVGTLKKKLAAAENRADAAEAKAEKTATKVAEKAAEKAMAAVKVPTVKGADGQDIKVTFSPAPKFETADGEYSFKVGGFAQIDAGIFNDDRTDHPDGTNIRRARINASGNITRDWYYKIENDFGLGTSVLTDAYIEYLGIENVSIMFGNFKEPFNLENLTSDLHVTFMERSLPTVFAPDRNIGLQVSTWGDTAAGAGTFAIGGFGANPSTASANDEARDLTARLTLAPVAEKDRVAHLGVAGSYRVPESATNTMTFSSRAENRLSSINAVSAPVTFVDHTSLIGLEAAGVYGPASIQGEYIMADVSRDRGNPDANFSGYYGEASYFFTGESRSYIKKSGRFDRVKPNTPFNMAKGGWGGWQVAARYSALDLDDAPIAGGKVQDVTLGLRWIPQPWVSFSLNYVSVDTNVNAVSSNDDPDIFMFRSQFDF